MKVFTTGQIAKQLKVAPRTVSKWIDSGELEGFRVNQDRRVTQEKLEAFCKARGYPVDMFKVADHVIVVSADPTLGAVVERGFAGLGIRVSRCTTGFKAGVLTNDHQPRLVVICETIGRPEADNICAELLELEDPPRIVAVTSSETTIGEATEWFRRPFDGGLFVQRVAGLIEVKLEVSG